MMRRISISLFAVLVAAACGGGKSSSSTSTTPVADTATPAPASSGVQLALGEMKLVDVNKNKAVLIHADGTVEFEGQKGVKVTADGKLVRSDTGAVGFQLQPDGTITGPDGKPVGVTLGADASIKSGDKTITLDDQGKLVGANPDAPPMRIEGATSVGLKRTALFVLIALTTPMTAPAASSGTP